MTSKAKTEIKGAACFAVSLAAFGLILQALGSLADHASPMRGMGNAGELPSLRYAGAEDDCAPGTAAVVPELGGVFCIGEPQP